MNWIRINTCSPQRRFMPRKHVTTSNMSYGTLSYIFNQAYSVSKTIWSSRCLLCLIETFSQCATRIRIETDNLVINSAKDHCFQSSTFSSDNILPEFCMTQWFNLRMFISFANNFLLFLFKMQSQTCSVIL